MAVIHALDDSSVISAENVFLDGGLGELSNRLLLHRALVGRQYASCLRLTSLFLEAGIEANALLYKSAALLELGDLEASFLVLESIPRNARRGRLSRSLKRAHELLSEHPEVLVYDRRGEAIGFLDGAGELQPGKSLEAGLIPAETLQLAEFEGYSEGVRLSIDLELSRLALSALEGYRGSIVLLDPVSGEVLTAVSDPATRRVLKDPALRQMAEPASVAKLVTTTAAFRSGLDVDQILRGLTCRGAERYRGGLLYCSYEAGDLEGLDHALAVSCNIAFAELGVLVGRARILEEFGRFGFGREDLRGLRFGRIFFPEGNERQLADLSIGLEATGMTPLNGALIASAIGNGGVMPKPSLVHAEDGFLGLSPVCFPPPEGWAVVDPEWIPSLLSAMEAVTQPGGTASRIIPEGVRFAMKTGTASSSDLAYYTNYVGVGPLPDPKLAFCVRVTHQRTSSRVRRATVRVSQRLMKGLAEKYRW
jgi:hypothetical protein